MKMKALLTLGAMIVSANSAMGANLKCSFGATERLSATKYSLSSNGEGTMEAGDYSENVKVAQVTGSTESQNIAQALKRQQGNVKLTKEEAASYEALVAQIAEGKGYMIGSSTGPVFMSLKDGKAIMLTIHSMTKNAYLATGTCK